MVRTVNLLSYIRSRSEVDFDSQDIKIAKTFGPFVDCTSNQADCYNEFLNPARRPLLKQSAKLARQLQSDYPALTFEQLAVDVAMTAVVLSLAPFMTGSLHIMANPMFSYSARELIANGQRIIALCRLLQPEFDTNRICVKVPATWEGFQACHKLKRLGINTLATTVFTMEQAMIAGEAGCAYIAPFLHELKALFDETYEEPGPPIVGLCVTAQAYFKHHNLATRVKAAGFSSIKDVRQLAGVTTLTLPVPMIEELSTMEEDEEEIANESLYRPGQVISAIVPERINYMDNEDAWRQAFADSEGGRGAAKTRQAIDIFSEYQIKAEELMLSMESM